MKRLLRTMLLWLVILGAPLQGFAAILPHCSLPSEHAMAMSHHAHMGQHCHDQASPSQQCCDESPQATHGGKACCTCASCCLSAVSLPLNAAWPQILHRAAHLLQAQTHLPFPTVFRLERPPKLA